MASQAIVVPNLEYLQCVIWYGQLRQPVGAWLRRLLKAVPQLHCLPAAAWTAVECMDGSGDSSREPGVRSLRRTRVEDPKLLKWAGAIPKDFQLILGESPRPGASDRQLDYSWSLCIFDKPKDNGEADDPERVDAAGIVLSIRTEVAATFKPDELMQLLNGFVDFAADAESCTSGSIDICSAMDTSGIGLYCPLGAHRFAPREILGDLAWRAMVRKGRPMVREVAWCTLLGTSIATKAARTPSIIDAFKQRSYLVNGTDRSSRRVVHHRSGSVSLWITANPFDASPSRGLACFADGLYTELAVWLHCQLRERDLVL